MKNLREEIEKISKTYPIIKVMLFVDGFEDDLLNLFRSFALDVIGRDKRRLDSKGRWMGRYDEKELGYNQRGEDARQRMGVILDEKGI